MINIDDLKQKLRETIDDCLPDGTYAEATIDRIHALIGELVPHSPTPRPIDRQEFVQAPWLSHFAQFGPKHTAGKPIKHLTSLKLQSFARFPDIPVMVHQLEQEIRVDGCHYNNVADITTPDNVHSAKLVVWGRYHIEPEMPQRYIVDFYQAELVPPEGVDAEMLCAQFGLEPNAPLIREIKPPKLHSDIVYCDEDMRINYGSMGGVYVMRRLHHGGKSVSFSE